MIQRSKQNRTAHPVDNSFGTLGRYFGDMFNEIDKLAKSENPGYSRRNTSKWIVKNENVIRNFSSIVENDESSRHLIIGHTGIGKSSIVRQYFCESQTAKFDEDTKTLFVPLYFDSKTVKNFDSVYPGLPSKLAAAINQLPDLENFSIVPEHLGEFIKGHSEELLYTDMMDLGRPLDQLVEGLKKRDPHAFIAEQLKYCLTHSSAKKLVVILDDIDTIEDEQLQRKMIASVCRFTECMQNHRNSTEARLPVSDADSRVADETPQDTSSRYSPDFIVKMFVSCRPYTALGLYTDRQTSGYPFEIPVIIQNPVPLNKILELRYEQFIQENTSLTNRRSFPEAYKILQDVLAQAAAIDKDFILGVCNYNVREAMKLLQSILRNGKFIQKQRDFAGQFNLDRNNFILSSGTIVNSIALGESEIYVDHDGNKIKNLLSNSLDPDFDLLAPYLFLWLSQGQKFSMHDLSTYSRSEVEMSTFLQRVFSHISEKINLEARLRSLESKGLIEFGQSLTSKSSEREIRISPRGAVLWNDLQKRSFLIEFYRDDLFLPDESTDEEIWKLIRVPMQKMSHLDRLGSTIRLIDSYVSKEYILLKRLQKDGALTWFFDRTGGTILSKLLEEGFSRSLYKIIQSSNNEQIYSEVMISRNKVRDKIAETTALFNG